MPAPRKYPDELRERSIRFACDLVEGPEKLSVNAACRRVGEQLGIQPDTLRNWVKQAPIGTSFTAHRRLYRPASQSEHTVLIRSTTARHQPCTRS